MARTRICASLLVGVATLGLLGGCDSNDPEDSTELSVAGVYVGVVDGTGDTVTIAISIVETASDPFAGISLGGDGTLNSPGSSASFAVSGSYVHPLIEMDLLFGDRPPGRLTGQVDEDRLRIDGSLAAPGVAGTVSLQKE